MLEKRTDVGQWVPEVAATEKARCRSVMGSSEARSDVASNDMGTGTMVQVWHCCHTIFQSLATILLLASVYRTHEETSA